MKTVKSLLLGTAAGFVALTGAQAADLPLAEPVEYVKICDTYGRGYFYIPGTDTCLRISGYVRAEARVNFNDDYYDADEDDIFNDGDFAGYEEDDTLGWFARGDVRFDARSETEWGTLRSYIEIRANSGEHGGGGTELHLGFIQFAGFTIGRASSFYDFLPYDFYGDLFSDTQLETVAYTASFGSGFAATIAIEDKTNRSTGLGYGFVYDEDDTLVDRDFRGSQAWPNIVAALRVDQAWGSAQVSAAVQDNEGNAVDGTIFDGDPVEIGDDIGWAVQAGLSYNLPFATEGSFVWVQGSYGEGAVDYVLQGGGAGGALVGQLSDWGDFSDQVLSADGSEWINTELWAIGGGVHFQATETVTLAAAGLYWEYTADGYETADGLKVLGRVGWEPVENLHLGAEVGYASVEVGDDELDDLTLTFRAQRSF